MARTEAELEAWEAALRELAARMEAVHRKTVARLKASQQASREALTAQERGMDELAAIYVLCNPGAALPDWVPPSLRARIERVTRTPGDAPA